MDWITSIIFGFAVFLFGYVVGALVFASELKKRLIKLGADKEMVESLLGKKKKE